MQKIEVDNYVVSPSASDVATANQRQLRIALAMRGGVSLAVWIGGAVTELDRLRQLDLTAGGDGPELPAESPTVGDSIYRKLLELNGFNHVIVDVLSGASAGGLNGVVYAAAQAHGFEMGVLGGLWRSVGDIELLARETTAGRRAQTADQAGSKITRQDALRPPSLLRGDEFFYSEVYAAISTEITKARPPRRVERIALVLSATLYRPSFIKRLVDRTNVVEDGRSNALFRFAHDESGSTIACDPADPDDKAIRRLAMAARTTSSFPFAFEPARIGLGRDDGEVLDDLDFTGTFELPNPFDEHGTHQVIDGGVLDNIPVAAALTAVVDAPASGPTERWLCYLHPSPGVTAHDTEPMAGPRGIATLLRTLATRFNQESLLEDVDQLAVVNDGIERRRLARDMLLAPFSGLDGPSRLRDELAQGGDKTTAGRAILAQLEAQRVLRSLNQPRSVGCDDPPNVQEWPAERQSAFGTGLLKAHDRWAETRAPMHTITAQTEATSLLIAFARTHENRGSSEASTIKGKLYSIRAMLTGLADREDLQWCAVARTQEAGETLEWWIARQLDATLRTIKTDTAVELQNTWRRIGDAAIELSTIDTGHLPTPFSIIADCDRAQVHKTLEALVLTLLPVSLMGHGPWSPVSFVYVHGDAPTTLPFPKSSGSEALRAGDKLAGNQLANFAAFLSAKWRANDWMWGRLDAASTLVTALAGPRILDDPDKRQQLIEAAGVDTRPDADGDGDETVTDEAIVTALRDQLQAEIFAEEVETVAKTPDGAMDPATSAVSPTIDKYTVGSETLTALSERRRTRIGMRMAHLAFAVLRPSGGSPASRAIRLASSLLKPLFLFAVFTVVAPSRALLSLAIATATLQMTFWSRRGTEVDLAWTAATRIFMVIVAVNLIGWIWRRWWLRSKRRSPNDDAWLGSSATVGTLACCAFVLLVFEPAGGRYIALSLLNLLIATIAGRTLFTRAKGSLFEWASLFWVGALTLAIVGMVVGLVKPLWDGEQTPWSALSPVLWVLIGAAALVTLFASSWMQPVYVAIAVVLTIAVALGTLTLTQFDEKVLVLFDSRMWLWVALTMLALIFADDVARLFRYVKTRDDSPDPDGESKLSTLPALLIWLGLLAAIGIVLTRLDIAVSAQTWAWMAGLASLYSNVTLSTHQPVFKAPTKLSVDEERAADHQV